MSKHLQARSNAARPRHAFTLIELLVVISIIALLIGILLPALAAARDTARTAQCLSNVRSMAQGAYIFAADHKDHIPLSSSDTMWNAGGGGALPGELRGKVAPHPAGGSRILDWASATAEYMGGGDGVPFDQADPKVSEAFVCPNDPHTEGHYVGNNISSGLTNYAPLSYAPNADATTWDNGSQDWGFSQQLSVVNGRPVPGALNRIRNTTNTMFFADGGTRTVTTGNPVNRGDVLMYTGSSWITPGEPGTLDAVYQATWARAKMPIRDNQEAEDRHRNAMNIAYADGHAGSSSPDDFDNVHLSPHLD